MAIKNTTVLEQLQEQHKPILAPCNGHKTCGKCKVVFEEPTTANDVEIRLLSQYELDQGIRLACTRFAGHHGTVTLVDEIASMKIESQVTIPSSLHPFSIKRKVNDEYVLYRFGKPIRTTPSNHLYSIAIDIGTTTCAVVLLDMILGKEVEQRTFINPQTSYGSDVIHRIQYAGIKTQRDVLQSLITQRIDQEILALLQANGIDHKDVSDIVIAGNTTMYYLLLGFDPTPLAQAPYKADKLNLVTLPYTELFPSKLDAIVSIFGGIDAFVGGDILSGIYALSIHQSDTTMMLVDLGTNGEIVVGNSSRMVTASTAAGPAFEGVNIVHGTGAISGAIDSFQFPDNITTIHNQPPRGICGSGLIDIVSELLHHKIIHQSGYLEKSYPITTDISLEPKDVREVQLAKAAIRAGIEHLLADSGYQYDDIDVLYIAGGFGKHINYDRLRLLGMIPEQLLNKMVLVGNTSLNGAVKYLFQTDHTDLHHIKERCDVVSLGTSKAFQERFVDHILFDS